MSNRSAGYQKALLLIMVLAATACGNETSSIPRPTAIEVLQGPPAAGSPGAMLIDTLRIRLVDDEGTPQAGEPIVWTILQGSGTITPLSGTTNASGVAEARWRLGQTSGINQVEASSPDDSTVVFETVGEAFRVDRLDSNYGVACGLTSGDLWCWGQYALGEAGVPVSLLESPFDFFPVPAPGPVALDQHYTDVAVGWQSLCALGPGGAVDCYENSGLTHPAVPAMGHIAGTDSWLYCGITMGDSTAWCWDLAADTAGQVGPAPKFLAVEMEALLGVELTACGLATDSTAHCWGVGPLGDGTFNPSATPVPVSGGHKFVELAVGEDFGCGVEPSGDVWCWGRNDDGQLGNVGPDAASPIYVTSGVTRIATANHTVMVIRFGTVERWGYFGVNGGGNPMTPLASVSHLPVSDLASNDTSCLRLVDGQVYCFDEIWVNSSTVDIDRYAPVQPVVTP